MLAHGEYFPGWFLPAVLGVLSVAVWIGLSVIACLLGDWIFGKRRKAGRGFEVIIVQKKEEPQCQNKSKV